MMRALPDCMTSLIVVCELTKVQGDIEPEACDVAGLTNRDRSRVTVHGETASSIGGERESQVHT